MNVSTAEHLDLHDRLGVRWVRFENAKWPFNTDKPHQYAFDGRVAPWRVDADAIIGAYAEAGYGVLPMLFQTPSWAVEVPDGFEGKAMRDLPPRDPGDYGEFCFQFAARYGGEALSSSELLTDDKASGKGQVRHFEIWNEPNLNPRRGPEMPSWGPWRSTLAEFWPVFRAGAEGVKAAYPDGVVTSPGFAGMTPETVDSLRTHVYADGKRPIDFVDVINVHFYSGKHPPETAGKDPNTGNELSVRYDEHLRRLTEWRDRHRPGAPIWLTETGHDTGGPIGISEEMQAARLPRNLMIAIQNGVDRVFIYRETGSTPTKHAAAGLQRNDGSRKPAWYSIATLTRQLHGAHPVCRLPIDSDNVRAYLWERDGQPLVTAWTVEGVESLDLALGGARVTDAFGHETQLASTQGMLVDDFPRYLTEITDPNALTPLVEKAEQIAIERRQRLDALAKQPAYLFDFGGGDEPVSIHVGKMRVYDKVPANTRYTADRGFGFEDGARLQDAFQHWHKPVPEKHSVVVPGDVAFRFDTAPGTYDIELLAEASRNKERRLTISGDNGSTATLVLLTKNREPQHVRISTKSGSIQLIGDGDYQIRWLKAIIADQN
ncbi:MAG: hypothetical protein AAFY08_05855 [Planctomycetota bacterium]